MEKDITLNYRKIFLWIAGITLLQLIISYLFQERISVNEGFGWDGVYYKEVAQKFFLNERITTVEPFGHRIGLPYLAQLISPDNFYRGFFILNLIAVVLQPFLLALFFSDYIKNNKVIILLVALYTASCISHFKFLFFAAATPDIWTVNLFIILMLLAKRIFTKQNKINFLILFSFTLITIIGTLVREIFIVTALAILLVSNPIQIKDNVKNSFKALFKKLPISVILTIPLIAAVITYTLIYQYIDPTQSDYTSRQHAWMFLINKSIDHYIVSLFVAFGSTVYFVLLNPKMTSSFFYKNQHLLFLTLSFLFLGFIGGSATFRLIYWISPIIYLVAGLVIVKELKNKNYVLLSLLLIVHIISQRIYYPILPDYDATDLYSLPIFTPFDLVPPLFDIYGTGAPIIVRLQFFEYFLFGLFLIAYQQIIRKFKASNNSLSQNGVV